MCIETFIGYLKNELRYSAHTLRAYNGDLRAFEEYLASLDDSISLVNVDSDMVRGWVAALMDEGSSAATVNRRLSSLRTFYTFLCSEGHISDNPLSFVTAPKRSKHLPVFLKESEVNELLDEDDSDGGFEAAREKAIIMCFYLAGLRRSELIGLNVADVDMAGCCLKVLGKRNKERVVPFAAEMSEVLDAYAEYRAGVAAPGESAFFVSRTGRRLSQSWLYKMINQRLKQVTNVRKTSPHVLRHTFATAMLNNGAELGAVKELLGHRRLATTEVYTHLTFEDLKMFYKKAHPRAGK